MGWMLALRVWARRPLSNGIYRRLEFISGESSAATVIFSAARLAFRESCAVISFCRSCELMIFFFIGVLAPFRVTLRFKMLASAVSFIFRF